MISKNKKRKILVPKAAKLRKCSVQLGQIDNIITRINSTKRKTYGKPATPGTKLLGIKNDLFRKTSTPLSNNSGERLSKRTPKPNRRYVNDETLNSSSWPDKAESSEQQSDEEDADDVESNVPQSEPTKKIRNRIPAPKSVTAKLNKGADKVALTKRKIVYDERPGPKQSKKVRMSFDLRLQEVDL